MGSLDWSNPIFYVGLATVILAGLWRVAVWVTRMNVFKEDTESLKKTISESLDSILSGIEKLLEKSSASVKSGSPRTLTPLGKEISTELSVSTWAKEQITQALPDVRDKENFEIEKFSFAYVANETVTKEAFRRKIQKCAYERGLTDSEIQAVFAIELRDALLAMSGNISV